MDFISLPVVAGFVSAAAITIIGAQLLPLTGLDREYSRIDFIAGVKIMIEEFPLIRCADTLTGLLTVLFLVGLKYLGKIPYCPKLFKFISKARYLIMIITGSAVAHGFQSGTGELPFQVTATLVEGSIPFEVPRFSTTIDNSTLNFFDMVEVLGMRVISIPILSALQMFVVAKVFGGWTEIKLVL